MSSISSNYISLKTLRQILRAVWGYEWYHVSSYYIQTVLMMWWVGSEPCSLIDLMGAWNCWCMRHTRGNVLLIPLFKSFNGALLHLQEPDQSFTKHTASPHIQHTLHPSDVISISQSKVPVSTPYYISHSTQSSCIATSSRHNWKPECHHCQSPWPASIFRQHYQLAHPSGEAYFWSAGHKLPVWVSSSECCHSFKLVFF